MIVDLQIYVPKLQSHKFLLLFYQLAARMGVQQAGSGDSSFNSTLTQVHAKLHIFLYISFIYKKRVVVFSHQAWFVLCFAKF